MLSFFIFLAVFFFLGGCPTLVSWWAFILFAELIPALRRVGRRKKKKLRRQTGEVTGLMPQGRTCKQMVKILVSLALCAFWNHCSGSSWVLILDCGAGLLLLCVGPGEFAVFMQGSERLKSTQPLVISWVLASL